MSSRALKARLAQEEVLVLDESSDSDEEEDVAPTHSKSLFALLESESEESESEEEVEEPEAEQVQTQEVSPPEEEEVQTSEPEEEEAQEDQPKTEEVEPQEEAEADAPAAQGGGGKKKKKRHGKRGNKQRGKSKAEPSAPENPAELSTGSTVTYSKTGERVVVVAIHRDDDEPYYTIQMPDGREKQTPGTNLRSTSAAATAPQNCTQQAPVALALLEALAVAPAKLNPMAEMKRIFGSRVVNATQAAARAGRNVHGSKQHMRRTVTCAPLPEWPPMTDGIELKREDGRGPNSAGEEFFRYRYVGSYHYAEQWHAEAVQSMDPNQFILLLQQYPYHCPTLLQLAQVYRSQGSADAADIMIQQALYALEYSWETSRFPALAGRARLDPTVHENKPLFMALFQRMLAIGRQGCFSSAFEFCKLILGLAPVADPCGVLQCVDYYCLRAKEYNGLLQLVSGFEAVRSVTLLPNISFSTALAQFHLDKDSAAAASAVQQALAMFPYVLVLLVQQLGSSAYAPGVDWSSVLSQPHFTINNPPSSASLKYLIEMFVKRSSFLWKQPDVLHWLHANACTMLAALVLEQDEITDLVAVARDQYPASSTNSYRHLNMNEFTDAVDFIPEDEINMAPAGANNPMIDEPAAQLYNPDLDASVVGAFLESMLPWQHAPAGEPVNPAQQAIENAQIDAWFEDEDP